MGRLSALKAAGQISANSPSGKKLAQLRKTKNQPTKMANFNSKAKDEAQAHGYGAAGYDINQINNKSVQTPSLMSKGGRNAEGRQPTRGQIDDKSMQGKKWVPGSDVSGSNPKTGNTKMKGKIPAQGGQYGGGGRNTQ